MLLQSVCRNWDLVKKKSQPVDYQWVGNFYFTNKQAWASTDRDPCPCYLINKRIALLKIRRVERVELKAKKIGVPELDALGPVGVFKKMVL